MERLDTLTYSLVGDCECHNVRPWYFHARKNCIHSAYVRITAKNISNAFKSCYNWIKVSVYMCLRQ